MVALLFAGVIGHSLLPIASLPEVDYPTIQVSTLYPGANPHVMSSSITAPLERQLGQMPGLNQMNSTSSNGASYITLQFTLATSLDVAEQEVQAAINAASGYLPKGLPTPPIYSKVNPADTPILTIALTSKLLPLYQVEDYAETRLAQKISQLSGVGIVEISGGQRPAVRIQANSTQLASFGLTMADIRNAVTSANANAAKGTFDGTKLAYTINANDQLLSSKDYQSLIIAYKNNAPIYLNDVAEVRDDVENTMQAAWVDKEPAIILDIKKQPGANIIKVADSIKQRLPQLSAALPAGIEVKILSDRTNSIRSSIADVNLELLLAVLLVVMVIFLFLRNWRSTIIPSLAVPLSLVGSFSVMYLMGFSLNNLTLMALTISTGFVVDDAIVMIENISRYIEQGMKPLEAALKGAGQICFTIISLTLSLLAVLIPLFFMEDIIGRMFKEFASTLAITIIISAIISLTLTPMLCAYILKPYAEMKQSKLAITTESAFNNIIMIYGKWLKLVLNNQNLVLIASVIIFTITMGFFFIIPKGFFPIQDTGFISAISVMDDKIAFETMTKKQQDLAEIILKDKSVKNLSSFVGISSNNSALNKGNMLIALKDRPKRKDNATEIIDRLKPQLKNLPGAYIYLHPISDISINSAVSNGLYQYTLTSQNQDTLSLWTDKLVDTIKKIPGILDVSTNQQKNGLEVFIDINRDTASRLGVTMQTIDDALYDMFGQRQVSTIFTDRNQYHVVLEVKPNLQNGLSSLNNVYVSSQNGTVIPLLSFAKISTRNSPSVINNQDQFHAVTISFDIADNISLGKAVSAINKSINALHLPYSVKGGFQGEAKMFYDSLSNEGLLILASIIVMYIILGILYESYLHPLTILSTIPSACLGALIALFITGKDLDVVSIIGVILLIGIVSKNAIMMVDFALEEQRLNKKTAIDAIYNACMLRFRPILMTTMAAMLGAVPLILGGGIGSELREPLGVSIIGGLIVSQMLTLFTVPVIYLLFDRLSNKINLYRQEE